MLKLTDDGAKITLTGKPNASGGGLVGLSLLLLLFAVGVALAMSFLPERLAIGALALLVVGCLLFNWLRLQRQRQQNRQPKRINSGVVWVRPYELVYEEPVGHRGKRQHLTFTPDSRMHVEADTLLIYDKDDTVCCQVAGFEHPKEMQVMQQILQGNALHKRHAKIRMQSSE